MEKRGWGYIFKSVFVGDGLRGVFVVDRCCYLLQQG